MGLAAGRGEGGLDPPMRATTGGIMYGFVLGTAFGALERNVKGNTGADLGGTVLLLGACVGDEGPAERLRDEASAH